jgi:hypothetical protein
MVLRAVVVPCVLSAACSFHHGEAAPDAPDASPPDASVCTTWNARHFDACTIPPPSEPLDLTGDWVFDTDTGTLTPSSGVPIMPAGMMIVQPGGAGAYVMSVAGLAIEANGSLRVIGSVPLIVASWQDIAVAGTIDAGSTPAQAGAGASPKATCDPALATSAQPGQIAVMTGGSGGGGGGAFGGAGGHGGIGDNPQGPLGGAGGVAQSAPVVVIGGCSGAVSGQAGPGDTAGDPTAVSPAGIGGGAVELSARVSIRITGHVLAGGGGGGGAPAGSASGGGGGGAGGYLGFDSPAITWTGAVVAANGGGGGSSGPFAGTGNPGQDGQPSATGATGGAATSCAEAGMVGAAGTTSDGASSTNPLYSCGGAGGGGGVGFVLTWGQVTQSGAPTISPAARQGG